MRPLRPTSASAPQSPAPPRPRVLRTPLSGTQYKLRPQTRVWTQPRGLPPEGDPHSWPGPSHGLAPSPDPRPAPDGTFQRRREPAALPTRFTAQTSPPPRALQPAWQPVEQRQGRCPEASAVVPAPGGRARFPSKAEERDLAWGAVVAARRTRSRRTVPRCARCGCGRRARVRAERTGWAAGRAGTPSRVTWGGALACLPSLTARTGCSL